MLLLFYSVFFLIFESATSLETRVDVSASGEIGLEENTEQENEIIERFRKYIQIRTEQPTPDYLSSVEYLKSIMESVGLETRVVEFVKDKPLLLGLWKGSRNDLKSVLLYSHMDVVHAKEEEWKYPPFSAHMDESGNIYGRGTQDMKSVGMAFLESVSELSKSSGGEERIRNVWILFSVDEEIGGEDGMALFVQSEIFKEMNVGIVLDEGAPEMSNDTIFFYCGERSPLWVEWISKGKPGHGSKFVPNTAVSKMSKFMSFLYRFRDEQEMIMNGNEETTLGDVISVNINAMMSGIGDDILDDEFEIHPNVIPQTAHIWTDFRHPPSISTSEMLEMFDIWKKEYDVEYNLLLFYEVKNPISDPDDPLAKKVLDAVRELGIKVKIMYSRGGSTDSRYVRKIGINSFGMSPIFNTKPLLHGNDEYIHKDSYLRMIQVYKNVILKLLSTDES